MCRRAYIWINSYIHPTVCVCVRLLQLEAQRAEVPTLEISKNEISKAGGKRLRPAARGTLLKAVNTILAYFVVKCCRFFACMQQGRDENDVYTITYTKQIEHSQIPFVYMIFYICMPEK